MHNFPLGLIIVTILGVSIHWTGLLDWNTGLDYWTEVFSFFGQDSGFWFTSNI